ncbi:kinase-like protein [Rhizophagus irregularis]|uniref:Kinase-like protein n=2 Tax=Rhizophagus irregularis TaxID=588596 RepID=A0A2I1E3C7_9GLOM|nr:kinase-like protein [Rhizophagus irregularis]PKC66816.1 kinase-like protein [Rhizophagus irregularis]PKY16628.1 kinase-like protein [Rhizophagus irregularis]
MTSNKNSFDPTPKLKSSPTEILFIPFNINKSYCYCGNEYLRSKNQKYCIFCLFVYTKFLTDNDTSINTYLDVYVDEHFIISYFKQIVSNQLLHNRNRNLYETCKLCGHKRKSIICPGCYIISFEFSESTYNNQHIPILYLPWWDAYDQCIVCGLKLNFSSDCQKWCKYCIIIYIGCRYCLTTNIIFGIAEKSQCKKCKRISTIIVHLNDMTNIIKYFLEINAHNYDQIYNYVNNIDENSNLLEIYHFIKKLNYFPLRILYSQIANLENPFDLAIPIMFIPFHNNMYSCYYCKKIYSETSLFNQRYCKDCFYWCIKCSTSNKDIKCAINNLDICISTTSNINCDKHEPRKLDFCVQEWCENCSEITYFKQIVTDQQFDSGDYYEENCRLCEKLIYIRNDNYVSFNLCSNCYLISFELIQSNLINKRIPILYLPWWDTYDKCIICYQPLEPKTDCQKWCSNCFIIYIGCRYCLTTNIIFGFIHQSQCKKCKRNISVNITGNYNIDEFIYFKKINIDNYHQINCYINNIKENSNPLNPLNIYRYIKENVHYNNPNNDSSSLIKLRPEWIPFSKLTNLEQIARGGHGIIHKASYDGNIVAVKEVLNSQNTSRDFLNELKLLYKCYDRKFEYIIKCHGVTRNLMTKEFMFIMKYANGGDLHNYLQKHFTKITWKDKLHILWRISDGLQAIHKHDLVHRDFHSGNILVEIIEHVNQYLIGDLGLSQPANNTLSSNEIYGVIPYIAPEIFGGKTFSKESDVYSMGMIMWELTTGCKPFANVEHDSDLIYEIIDGKRPEITEDTPEDFANLMKKCWNSDPKKRPFAEKICKSLELWSEKEEDANQFIQAEKIRKDLIKYNSLGPKMPHSKATFTSISLSPFISKSSSKTIIKELNNDNEYVTRELDFDIDGIQSQSLSKTSSEINPSGKRGIENEIYVNKKHVKISNETEE